MLYSSRGDIVDQHGFPLATTRIFYELGVDPQSVEWLGGQLKDAAKLPALAELLGVSVADVEQAFATKYKEVDSGEGAEHQTIRWSVLNPQVDPAVEAKIDALKIKGIYA